MLVVTSNKEAVRNACLPVHPRLLDQQTVSTTGKHHTLQIACSGAVRMAAYECLSLLFIHPLDCVYIAAAACFFVQKKSSAV